MSRGWSYGGGQSSLGYLFGADEQPSAPTVTPAIQPPYGIDITPENPPPQYKPSSEQQTEKNTTNNYQRAKGQNAGSTINKGEISSRWRFLPGLPVWRQVMQ
ncbi:hypothetical protein ES319_A12G242400v1 [Gossypium barbadense]|uniref:Uncharacterized protein n=2 Tax=Gossypium TaxID=3633 RepID=A0A5J5TIJ3_GOSBA|nr:hypothetical protein ES319_A12G242400v1 [Gossypium barbadense]TYG91465.1 hypothetical protein ES288_A12G263600v1 [Gossypium darwinii]